MVGASALPEEGVDLVDKDDRRLQFPRKREEGSHKLVRFAIVLVSQGRHVEVDERRVALLGECLGQHRLATARRAIQEDTFGRTEQTRGGCEDLWIAQRVDDALPEVLHDMVQATDLCIPFPISQN